MNCNYFCLCDWENLQQAYNHQENVLEHSQSEDGSAIHAFLSEHIATDEQIVHYGGAAGNWSNWCNITDIKSYLQMRFSAKAASRFEELWGFLLPPYLFELSADQQMLGRAGILSAISPLSCQKIKKSMVNDTFINQINVIIDNENVISGNYDFISNCQLAYPHITDECWDGFEKMQQEFYTIFQGIHVGLGLIIAAEL